MKRDNRQILVNPHSSQEKIPAGALNLGEIGVQHNNVEDAALYVETVADSESESTVAKFITEKAIDGKIENALDIVQTEIDSLNDEIGLPHDPEQWNSGLSVWQAIEQTYDEMTAGTAAANTKLFIDEAEGHDEKYLKLRFVKDDETSAVSYYIKSEGIDEAIDKVAEKVEELSAATQDVLDGLDFTGVTQEGKPIINVSQEDGLVNAEAGNIKAEFVEVNESGDTLDELLEEILETIDTNEVVLSAITPSGANVREEYALFNNAGDKLGTSIKIYKDSSLYEVYLGAVDDTLSDPTDPESIVHGSGDTALCFIYETNDGTYSLVAVDVESFLQENEFKNGLQVDNHIVSVKIDESSEKVKINGGGTADVLSVSEAGVKISNIQNAIDYAVDTLAEEVQEALDEEAAIRESADTAINEAIEALEDKLSGVSVEKGTSVENFVKLGVSNNGEGATAVTIDDSVLKQVIDSIQNAIEAEIADRKDADAELLGTSASTSAETSIWGVKNYVDEVVNDLDADAVQEVEFAAVAEKDETSYGSNAGAMVVPMSEGEVGKKLVLDLSLLKIDCGEY